ncbi:MAG: MFS transporter [Bacteroidetes bacterium]|nr:MAG: MFS transporter [Bacteroidota bacterium]
MKPGRDGFEKGKVLTISAVHFVHDCYTAFLAPALPLLIEKLGMSYGMTGMLAVIQRIPSLFNPLIGIIAERPVMRYMVIFSPALTAVFMSLIGMAPGYTFLAILVFFSGISSMLWHIPTPVMVRQLSGSRVGKGMSYYMGGGELARTAGPLVILGVISWWGLEGMWRMMPLGLVASVVLWFQFRKANFTPPTSSRKHQEGSYWKIFLRFSTAFVLTGGFTLFQAGMKASVTYFLPTFLTSTGNSLHYSEIALAVLQLSGAMGALFAGTISDKIGRFRTLLIISIGTPLLTLLFLNLEGFWIFPVLLPLGFFIFAPTSVMLATVQELNTEKKAFVNSIYMTLNFFVSVLVYPLVGASIDRVGFLPTFRFIAYLGFGAILIVLLTRKGLQKTTGTPVQSPSS